ncbi:hypothetical protein GJAV_G00156420 [Gymnothorax javanicus]|nr:hypothetical protein GJAV_G00156420 [Gymnothorax javanicus]
MYGVMAEEYEIEEAEAPDSSFVYQTTDFNGDGDSPFFSDGKRRIDFILVYEEEKDQSELQKSRIRRAYYEASLMKMGLELEATRSVLDERIMFVKVHTPWDVLCTYAEVLHIKLPIQPDDLLVSTDASPFHCITKHFYPRLDLITAETECFTAPFERSRLASFYIKDGEQFFSDTVRTRVANYILKRAPFEVRGTERKFGINKLLDSGVYKAAYPLHDGKFHERSLDERCPNERLVLYREWAHPINFYKMQPLDLIRKYFGEKIGIYFAWLGFYTCMLIAASAVGLGCFIYGFWSRETSTWSKEVCDPLIGGSIVMCPQCDQGCSYWRLNSTCESSKKLCIFDNYGTVVYAVFMAVWVTLFLEFWKRYQATLEYEWDTEEFLEQEEQPRPEYEAHCTLEHINPITRESEKVPFTRCGKNLRLFCGFGTVAFWVLLIVASVVGVIVYRLAAFFVFSVRMRQDLQELEPLKEYVTPQMATSITASIISFIIIMLLNYLYQRVAIWVTDFELPRTKTEYENSLTLKMFLFQFVNFYSSCFYIAFFKGKVVGHPGEPVYLLGRYRNEECDPGGCLIELTTQLTVIMGGKAIWNNIQEVLFPWVKNMISRRLKNSASETVIPRWEQDYRLQPVGKLCLFREYLEMVIQFGFVTLFVASFPLAPLLALINNMVEIRVDAWKITTQFRRNIPEKAQDIGAWQPILRGVAILAVATNATIIAFTSDMIPRLVYYWSFSVYPNGPHSNSTMEGYINSTLSVFNTADFSPSSKPLNVPYWFHNITSCRYRDFRHPPGHPKQYEHNAYYWHVTAAKLAFIIVMEHIVYFTKFVLSYAIPDVPGAVRDQMKRERYLTQVILHEAHLRIVPPSSADPQAHTGSALSAGARAETEERTLRNDVDSITVSVTS